MKNSDFICKYLYERICHRQIVGKLSLEEIEFVEYPSTCLISCDFNFLIFWLALVLFLMFYYYIFFSMSIDVNTILVQISSYQIKNVYLSEVTSKDVCCWVWLEFTLGIKSCQIYNNKKFRFAFFF